MKSLLCALLFPFMFFWVVQPAFAAAKADWDIASSPGEATDEWGLTATDWLVLTDDMLIGKARVWEKFPLILEGVRKRDVKATTLWVIANEGYGRVGQMAGYLCDQFEFLDSFAIVEIDAACKSSRNEDKGPAYGRSNAISNMVMNSRDEFDARYPNSGEKWPYGPFARETKQLLFDSDLPRAWLPFYEHFWTLRNVPRKFQGIKPNESWRILLMMHDKGLVPATIELAQYCNQYPPIGDLTDFCKNRQAIFANAMDRGSGAAAEPLIVAITQTERDVNTPKFQQVPELITRAIKMGYWPGRVFDTNGGSFDENGNWKGAAFVSKAATLGFIKHYETTIGMKDPTAIRYTIEQMDRNAAAFAAQDRRRALRGPTLAKETLAPNISTVSAAIIHELQYALSTDPRYQFTRFLETSSAVGQGSKLIERWDYNEGKATLSAGGPETMGTYAHYAFDISDVKCTKVAGAPTSYDCAFNAALYVNQRLGPMTLIDQAFLPAPVNLRIVWAGSRWSSPQLRAKFVQGVANSASGAPAAPGQSQICRSLNAGVVAAGGRSEYRALNPQTWGC